MFILYNLHNGSVLLTNKRCMEQLEWTQILSIQNVWAAQQISPKIAKPKVLWYSSIIEQHFHFSINNWSVLRQSNIFFIFQNGWVDFREAFYVALCFITLHSMLKVSKYKVYWLMDFPLINSWACLEGRNHNLYFEVAHPIVIQKSNNYK